MPYADIPNHTKTEHNIAWAINAERRRHGLRSLRARRGLARVADGHSADQLRFDRMQHDGFDGKTVMQRIRFAGGYKNGGEVIAWVPDGLSHAGRKVVAMWMASPGHAQQLLRGDFRFLGVGAKFGTLGGERGWMITADFGG
ncbi:CAP domain-containing protein [Conexibacter sp. SYSU D00693]|uniref:CAP domain-containing protein n=1 Tax=Conexibacter sp. SYSU D00693 TaxID=2812560 RepID=UPI00196AE480|nr:CAP domain-containing protein [Conexibacter sp. SYSU D00693]